MLNYYYVTDEQIKGFDKYKYSSIDTSPLSNYVMHPFWNKVVKIVPQWIAPNILTFTGFILIVANAVLLSYYDYYFYASSDTIKHVNPIPSWVWLVCAINHFLAHTLDGIDGKHARRTNSSGPTGELIDHGLDSWTAFFLPFCIYSLFGRVDQSCPPFRVLFIFWSIFLTFYLSHWEKYNTGILYLPWSYDVSQLILLSLYLITFFFTHRIWKVSIPFLNVPSGHIFEMISHVSSLGCSIPITFYNVYKSYKCNYSKQKNIWESLRPLVPLTILFLVTTYWATYSPNDVVESDPRAFYCLVGTVFSNIACRLIISQMSSTQCEIFNWFMLPLCLSIPGIFTISMLSSNELLILRSMTFFYIVAHIHYGVCVFRQLCDHFDIYCFKLGKKMKEKNSLKVIKNGFIGKCPFHALVIC